eukprot:3607102-Amphidinium_carterae.1
MQDSGCELGTSCGILASRSLTYTHLDTEILITVRPICIADSTSCKHAPEMNNALNTETVTGCKHGVVACMLLQNLHVGPGLASSSTKTANQNSQIAKAYSDCHELRFWYIRANPTSLHGLQCLTHLHELRDVQQLSTSVLKSALIS